MDTTAVQEGTEFEEFEKSTPIYMEKTAAKVEQNDTMIHEIYMYH